MAGITIRPAIEAELFAEKLYRYIRETVLEYDARIYHGELINIDELTRRTRTRILDAFIDYINEIEKDNNMPNSVSYSDESTITKVYTALAGNGEMSFPDALAVVNRLHSAGILFREKAEEQTRGPRKKNADGTDTSDPEDQSVEGTKQDAPVVDPPVQQ